MKSLVFKFIASTVLTASISSDSFVQEVSLIPYTPPAPAKTLAILEAKMETAKLEEAGARILIDTVVTSLTASGKNAKNVTSKICAVYNGKNAVQGPNDLQDAYLVALRKEYAVGADIKDSINLRDLIMRETVKAIHKNAQAVRDACAWKFGT